MDEERADLICKMKQAKHTCLKPLTELKAMILPNTKKGGRMINNRLVPTVKETAVSLPGLGGKITCYK